MALVRAPADEDSSATAALTKVIELFLLTRHYNGLRFSTISHYGTLLSMPVAPDWDVWPS